MRRPPPTKEDPLNLHAPATHGGEVAPAGNLTLVKTPGWPYGLDKRTILEHCMPGRTLTADVNEYRLRNFPNVLRGFWRLKAAQALGISHALGRLYLTVTRGDGTVEPLGLVSLRVVTDTGVGYIVDAFQNIVELELMKFHGFGTGTTAESAAQTALVTEFTTEYAVNSTRPTGTTTEGASGNIYRTVATFTPDSGGVLAVTEHGIFSATSAGVMLDRSKFAAVNLDSANGDSITSTYDFTITSGG